MSRLPPELWLEVITYLSPDDVHRLRTFNESFRKASLIQKYGELCLDPKFVHRRNWPAWTRAIFLTRNASSAVAAGHLTSLSISANIEHLVWSWKPSPLTPIGLICLPLSAWKATTGKADLPHMFSPAWYWTLTFPKQLMSLVKASPNIVHLELSFAYKPTTPNSCRYFFEMLKYLAPRLESLTCRGWPRPYCFLLLRKLKWCNLDRRDRVTLLPTVRDCFKESLFLESLHLDYFWIDCKQNNRTAFLPVPAIADSVFPQLRHFRVANFQPLYEPPPSDLATFLSLHSRSLQKVELCIPYWTMTKNPLKKSTEYSHLMVTVRLNSKIYNLFRETFNGCSSLTKLSLTLIDGHPYSSPEFPFLPALLEFSIGLPQFQWNVLDDLKTLPLSFPALRALSVAGFGNNRLLLGTDIFIASTLRTIFETPEWQAWLSLSELKLEMGLEDDVLFWNTVKECLPVIRRLDIGGRQYFA
ncbi:hypothetical protein DL96DRAFT_1572175 [Flagelloscypha sp. PMI_526]|nr:hypothetical protein DL96DRAFT_1572175 [Flagelloscypha sp. PMI_526]